MSVSPVGSELPDALMLTESPTLPRSSDSQASEGSFEDWHELLIADSPDTEFFLTIFYKEDRYGNVDVLPGVTTSSLVGDIKASLSYPGCWPTLFFHGEPLEDDERWLSDYGIQGPCEIVSTCPIVFAFMVAVSPSFVELGPIRIQARLLDAHNATVADIKGTVAEDPGDAADLGLGRVEDVIGMHLAFWHQPFIPLDNSCKLSNVLPPPSSEPGRQPAEQHFLLIAPGRWPHRVNVVLWSMAMVLESPEQQACQPQNAAGFTILKATFEQEAPSVAQIRNRLLLGGTRARVYLHGELLGDDDKVDTPSPTESWIAAVFVAPAFNGKTIYVTLQVGAGQHEEFGFYVHKWDTVTFLKGLFRAAAPYQLHFRMTRLTHRGRALMDSDTLQTYGIQNGSSISVTVPMQTRTPLTQRELRGGGPT